MKLFYDTILRYSTADVQVYKKPRVMFRASRKFEDNWCVGFVRHNKYTAYERLLTS